MVAVILNTKKHMQLSLNALITMVLWGPNNENTRNPYFKQAAITISQLTTFNTIKFSIPQDKHYH